MITIYFTRHSKSCQNLYDSVGRLPTQNIHANTFRDTPLCPEGIEKVIDNRSWLRKKMGKVDAILTSPLKRCIETTLLTYQDIKDKTVHPIYVMSLLIEYSPGVDSLGTPMRHLCSDPTVFSYRHFPALDFTYFKEGCPNQHTMSNMYENMEWCTIRHRMNYERTKWFFEFMKNHFQGKTVHVITHSLFIQSFLGYIPHNYETIQVLYEPDNGTFSWKIIE